MLLRDNDFFESLIISMQNFFYPFLSNYISKPIKFLVGTVMLVANCHDNRDNSSSIYRITKLCYKGNCSKYKRYSFLLKWHMNVLNGGKTYQVLFLVRALASVFRIEDSVGSAWTFVIDEGIIPAIYAFVDGATRAGNVAAVHRDAQSGQTWRLNAALWIANALVIAQYAVGWASLNRWRCLYRCKKNKRF